MNAMVNQAEMSGVQGGAVPRRRRLVSRALAVVAAAGLLGLLTGDGRAVAFIQGIDPLDVLNLKVRPNVIVVLDSSGSMVWGGSAPAAPPGNIYPPQGPDHPRSKIYQAKQVLKQIVTNNQDKVSFLMGQYTQDPNIVLQNTAADTAASGNADRFQYWTSTTLSPSMGTTELGIRNDASGSGERGLQSWQLIYAGWNTLYYAEINGGTTSQCTAALTGTSPRFYRTGGPAATAGTLAADLQTAMNGATCVPARAAGFNVYNVAYATATGRFTFSRAAGGTRSFVMRWSRTPLNIAGALNAGTTDSGSTTSYTIPRDPISLLYRDNRTAAVNTADYNTGGGFGGAMTYEFNETVNAVTVRNFNAWAGRFFNGEVIDVIDNGASLGQICNMTFPAAAARTNPPSFTLRGVTACGNVPNSTVRFDWGGPFYDGNNGIGCNGFSQKVALIPCDLQHPPAPTQVATIHPWLNNEFPLDATGMPEAAPTNMYVAAATTAGYTERQDGTWATQTSPPYQAGGIKAGGGTPVANSIANIRTIFANLWNNGQAGATLMAGPPPYRLDPIKNHVDPKEKTILIFVTDGADTCSGSGDAAALTTAQNARNLFQPVTGACLDSNTNGNLSNDPADSLTSTPPCQDMDGDGVSGFAEPASSVQTFMIGYGDGVGNPADVNRLNWVAWGGSGVYTNFPGYAGTNTAINTSLTTLRNQCPTCEDAFIAPDAATLASTIQGIIDQGATSGEFAAAGGGAAASITESVFEYVDIAAKVKPSDDRFHPNNPNNRYSAEVPTRYLSSFTLPGFRGQLKAYQNKAGAADLKWDAGKTLFNNVQTGMSTCNPGAPAVLGQCVFSQLHGGATDTSIATSTAVIKRRIYTTSQNGYFGVTVSGLITNPPLSPFRISLWPPQTTGGVPKVVAPTNYTDEGLFDQEMGLPLDSDPPATAVAALASLKAIFHACLGTNLPAECGTVPMKAARREARDIILAFMAGAIPVPDANANPKRVLAGTNASQIIYKAKVWILSESTMSTSAVIGPPFPRTDKEPLIAVDEWRLYRDGVRVAGKNTGSAVQITQGFGLAHPDGDGTVIPGVSPEDTRTLLKPVMTVVYTGANDMLHAFRAAPSCPTGPTPAPLPADLCPAGDEGGEELWGFVPYDQLGKLYDRYRDFPETKATKNYMIASSLRFADVFVPGPLATPSIGGVTVPAITGVWRKILFFGRGIGGKYLTALDVTAPGPYTNPNALTTIGPIPLWNRGNPDTSRGVFGGTANNTAVLDTPAYAKMGETWSVPALAFVDAASNPTTRRGSTDFVLYVGSGYGPTGEGTTFYTLDAITGDVVAAADITAAAASAGLTRTPAEVTYVQADGSSLVLPNTLVANAVAFVPARFNPLQPPPPAGAKATRAYIGDTHGRLWKILSSNPGVAIAAADLGAKQPSGTAVGLIGIPPGETGAVPQIYVTTGADLRATGPFHMYGFRDEGNDTDITTVGSLTVPCPAANCSVTPTPVSFAPVKPLFMRQFDQGTVPAGGAGLPESVFRGDIQPTTAYQCTVANGVCGGTVGRVFFGGARLNLPNTAFAPPTPLKFGSGSYPCRSSFDSIIFVLGATSGLAAYDLNLTGDDAFRIFKDERLAALKVTAPPVTGQTGRLAKEVGKVGGPVEPPDPPGVPPSSTTAAASVVLKAIPGAPLPAVRFGSSVCN